MRHRRRLPPSPLPLRQPKDKLLKSLHQDIGLKVALDHCLDLAVAPFKLLILLVILFAKLGVVAFELDNIASVGRARPRLFANGRPVVFVGSLGYLWGTHGRVRSRLFASVRLA